VRVRVTPTDLGGRNRLCERQTCPHWHVTVDSAGVGRFAITPLALEPTDITIRRMVVESSTTSTLFIGLILLSSERAVSRNGGRIPFWATLFPGRGRRLRGLGAPLPRQQRQKEALLGKWESSMLIPTGRCKDDGAGRLGRVRRSVCAWLGFAQEDGHWFGDLKLVANNFSNGEERRSHKTTGDSP
jgi:hypothetical protein